MSAILAIAGMPGSGKSEAAKYLTGKGLPVVRLGDLVDIEIRNRSLAPGEDTERAVREGIRKKHGMDAFARLNKGRIDDAAKKSQIVVVDGLYSMEEYEFLKKAYGENLHVLAIYASPKTRHARLASRKVRPVPDEKSLERDISEIKNLNKGGPIALADFTIVNEGTEKDLYSGIEKVLKKIGG